MPRLSDLTRQHPVSTSFEAGGESLTIVFDRNRITQNWMDRVAEATEQNNLSGIAKAVLEVLISWDVVDDDGVKLAPSLEILAQLPLSSFIELNGAIAEASIPSSEEGNDLGDTSSIHSTGSTEMQASPPNGQQPSPSPSPSESLSPT